MMYCTKYKLYTIIGDFCSNELFFCEAHKSQKMNKMLSWWQYRAIYMMKNKMRLLLDAS